MNKIRLFEMFAGFGGASFSLEKAKIDYECVGYSEIDKQAIELYNLNHPERKNFGDCRTLDPKELPDFDLLTAGFPCQPFSVNTNQNVRGTNHRDFDLFRSILRVLSVKKPTYFILENVKGIRGKKSRTAFEELKRGLKEMGYGLKIVDVNSKEYGTPQNRERVLFLGKLGSKEGEIKIPQKEKLSKSVMDLLEENPERRTPRVKNLRLTKESNLQKFGDISRLDAILKSPVSKKRDSNVLFEILDAPSNVVSRQSDRIYKPTYSPCLTATGNDYLFYVNEEVIVLTPRECFRLMGFFDDEINLGNLRDTSLHKLAGNGWDVSLMSKFMKCLIEEVKEGTQSKEGIINEIIKIAQITELKEKYKIMIIRDVLENGKEETR